MSEGVISRINVDTIDYFIASSAYCVCSTPAATAAKVASVIGYNADDRSTAEFTLVKGITIQVKFTYSNTATDPTLSVGGTNAKPIKRYGSTAVGIDPASSWKEGAVVSLTYTGVNWVMNTGSDNNESLTEYEDSTATSLVTRGEKYIWNRKAEILDITVPISAGTGVLATVTDSRIKADHKVIGYNIVWDNPAAITSDIIVTTSNGSLTINGTCTSATEATFQIGKILDEIDETVVWEEMEEMG